MKIGDIVSIENGQCERFHVEYLGNGNYLVKNSTMFMGGQKVMSQPLSKIRKWIMSCP